MVLYELGEKPETWQHDSTIVGEKLNIRVLFRDIEGRTWAQTPCAAIVASLSGRLEQDHYVPGLMYAFSRATDATRAALRCGDELRRYLPEGKLPPILIDVGSPLKELLVVSGHAPGGVITITPGANRYLGSEPLEKIPGPKVCLESGSESSTDLLPISTQNLGWALPVLALGGAPAMRLPVSSSGQPSPVINITMGDRKTGAFKKVLRLPWRYVFLLSFTAVALWGAYQILDTLKVSLGKQQSDVEESWGTEDEIAAIEPVEIVLPTTTPPPLGYGSVVIQTTPDRAKIFFNDVLVGNKSPVVLEGQSNQGAFKVMVTKRGYRTHTEIFNVQADERKTIHVVLEKN